MRTIKTAAVVGAVGLALAVKAAPGQDGNPQTPANPQAPVSTPGKPSGTPGVDKGNKPAVNPDKPTSNPSDGLQKIVNDAKAAREKFLQDRKELKDKLKGATAEEREHIRSELHDKLDAFLEQQKEMREEYQKRIEDLRQQLPSHGDLIDAAKEQNKNQHRKGGN